LSDDTSATSGNKTSGQHVYMIHSVGTDSAGVVTSVTFYDPYGRQFTMTDLDLLYYCASKVLAFEPK
jgi:hypothetical protein